MTDAPEIMAMRWEKGRGVTQGPLFESYTQWVRKDIADAAVAAERERCALLCLNRAVDIAADHLPVSAFNELRDMAKAIREGE